jgi:putative transposase
MPRTARAIEAGTIYHVLNRGNGRMRIFHDPADYEGFEQLLTDGLARFPVDLFTYCLMPNHWHLVLRPRTDQAPAELMRWIGATHVRRHHRRYPRGGGGHLYQGRFKSFPVEDDYHFLTVCRYVEANPVRARLASRAEQWRWCGLWRRQQRKANLPLVDWPEDRPRNWLSLVNEAAEEAEWKAVRVCVNRGRPYGSPEWVATTASRLDLGFTLRGVGRPTKASKQGSGGTP